MGTREGQILSSAPRLVYVILYIKAMVIFNRVISCEIMQQVASRTVLYVWSSPSQVLALACAGVLIKLGTPAASRLQLQLTRLRVVDASPVMPDVQVHSTIFNQNLKLCVDEPLEGMSAGF